MALGTERAFDKRELVLGAGSTHPRKPRGQARPDPWAVEAGLFAGSLFSLARGRPGFVVVAWIRVRAGTQDPCVLSSRPLLVKPSWWACIRSPSVLVPYLPHPAAGSSALLFLWGPALPGACFHDVVQCILQEGAGQPAFFVIELDV